MIPTAFLRNLC